MTKDESQLATQTAALVETFASRVPGADLDGLLSMARGGEWDELLDLLIAGIQATEAAVSADEMEQLREVLTGWGLSTDQLATLIVRD
jgi:hypothetical protein